METIGRSGGHRLHGLSLNGDSPVGPQNRTRNDPIRVNSCLPQGGMVFYCMDTAKGPRAGILNTIGRKSQTPNSKSQRNPKSQVPTFASAAGFLIVLTSHG